MRRSIVLLFVVSVITSGCHYVTACDLDYAAIFMRPMHAEVCDCAGLRHEAVDQVFLTGGTAFVPAVRRLFADRFGAAKLAGGGEFVSVAEGLALMGAG